MLAMLWICILSNETIDFGYFSFAESEEIDLIQSHRERILDSLTEQTKTIREVTRNFCGVGVAKSQINGACFLNIFVITEIGGCFIPKSIYRSKHAQNDF